MAALTLRGYAKHRRSAGLIGGSLEAVRKALKRGWIHAEPDGRIEPGRADREWATLHVPRVSVYCPGTRRLKGAPEAAPGAQEDKGEAHPLVIAHNGLVDLTGRLVGQLFTLDLGKRTDGPALVAELKALPEAIHTLKGEVMAILLYVVRLQDQLEVLLRGEATTPTQENAP